MAGLPSGLRCRISEFTKNGGKQISWARQRCYKLLYLRKMYSAASYLVAILLVNGSERTFRFVGNNYSWTTIFETLGKV
ncbi:hypothetical protein LAWI1_G003172 [Lachnellula willkommii]|uniref:Uncharacterized protein n=1 Tax=Lachnellula willkommii TaxID=215461 RepID=A0A559MFY4_9HELO|nr:hypothetical protein LAWI1_G003172 [Lachnellula willkommii]